MGFIYEIESRKIQALTFNQIPVWKRYKQLQNFLSNSLGKEFTLIFAEPEIQRNIARWNCFNLSDNAQSINTLNKQDKLKYKKILQSKLVPIIDLSKKLKLSTKQEEKKWGLFLELMLKIPSDDTIFVDGTNISIAAWGFKFIKHHEVSAVEFSIDKDIPQDYDSGSIEQNADNITEDTTEQNNQKQESNWEEQNNDNTEQNNQEQVTDNTEQNNQKQEVNDVEQNNQIQESNDVDQKVNNEEKNSQDTNSDGNKTKNSPKKKFWWWLIPLVIIGALCFFLFKKPKSVLPEKPNVIVPIDSNKIISDPDTITKIVSDRLNIALTGENQDIKKFAREFKNLYKSDDYKIIYYDTVTSRIQIQIPQKFRVKVKRELPEKMNDFSMLIWDENLFDNKYVPQDPGFSDAKKKWWIEAVKAMSAWNISRGNSNIVVAIIDESFDLNHPELKGKIVKPWNIPAHSPDVQPYGGIHGTHVAGIAIGNANNSSGVCGIAPNCKFMPIQVGDRYGQMTNTAVIDAVLYAIGHGANVVNMSLGMNIDPRIKALPINEQNVYRRGLFKSQERFWDRLFKKAYKKNIVFVLAAGNDNVIVGLDPMQRSNKTIKVSAIDPRMDKASFSNFGELSTISAPGVHIYSSVPNGKFKYLDGTSMASPVVTGGVAILKSINPALSFDEIVDLMQSTGMPIHSSAHIGNLLQLSVAANIAQRRRAKMPRVGCGQMQAKIDSLLQEIEKIKQQCEDSSTSGDTLEIPPDASNVNFAVGRWKSTTYLYNESGDKVTLYFDFYADKTGKISFIEEDNTEYKANLKLSLQGRKFIMEQTEEASCINGNSNKQYVPYYFKAEADNTGKALCWAQNKTNHSNQFNFNLIKIN